MENTLLVIVFSSQKLQINMNRLKQETSVWFHWEIQLRLISLFKMYSKFTNNGERLITKTVKYLSVKVCYWSK